ncbi:hypothetical protein [Lutispora sp.]|uniref:hypothetical protein n=1 Tax=Lutispora sp. TaxID=2828727 RepID=UPI000EDEFF6C|nr:hypothetical protein [Lutispora sp.]MEA4960769.1 hypothetical protein [Lutispora sp.]HCJ56928.1 hypothetical protein [Clostridiaceae bacterium]
MDKNPSGNKLIIGLLTAALLFPMGASAFGGHANEASEKHGNIKYGISADYKAGPQFKIAYKGNGEGIKAALDSLVEERTITREKADKIMQYIEQRKARIKSKRMGLLEELKKEGIITDAEADKIREKRSQIHEEKISKDLDGLVEKGIIKSRDVEKIKDYLKIEREGRRKMFEQLKGMTEEQKKEFFQNYKKSRKDVVQKMVDDKIITKEQAEEIRKIMPQHNKYNKNKQ